MDTQEGALLEMLAEDAAKVKKPRKAAVKKAKAAKPKAKKVKAKKPAKKKLVKKAAKKLKLHLLPKLHLGNYRSERLDMRLTKAEKIKVHAKAKKLRRTVTSIVIEAIEKIK